MHAVILIQLYIFYILFTLTKKALEKYTLNYLPDINENFLSNDIKFSARLASWW